VVHCKGGVLSVDIVKWVQLEELVTLSTGASVVEVRERLQIAGQLHARGRELSRHSESRM
jgi:hypothetical protein